LGTGNFNAQVRAWFNCLFGFQPLATFKRFSSSIQYSGGFASPTLRVKAEPMSEPASERALTEA
jgi:hypothetical protein